eukprot:CAMPEP_0171982578 /NCGR_PEP_ID=MMETSP0993-20121228/271960_1 /TAXON_ID=483369 /ORGANISM="non described non described, Strain CCMP2098" /LENGTH=54 /DNA_ID=CAMNT_0012635215 /DNA_START=15 /DNA_END=176 /DNA_ORIENTATION=+
MSPVRTAATQSKGSGCCRRLASPIIRFVTVRVVSTSSSAFSLKRARRRISAALQ